MITFDELVTSRTAESQNIPNRPSEAVVRNMVDLLSVLNAVRAVYDKPIIVTSGYRSVALNCAVGGKPTSAHLFGLAADVKPQSGKLDDYFAISDLFCKFAARLRYHSIVIYEKPDSSGIPRWVHLELSLKKPTNSFWIK